MANVLTTSQLQDSVAVVMGNIFFWDKAEITFVCTIKYAHVSGTQSYMYALVSQTFNNVKLPTCSSFVKIMVQLTTAPGLSWYHLSVLLLIIIQIVQTLRSMSMFTILSTTSSRVIICKLNTDCQIMVWIQKQCETSNNQLQSLQNNQQLVAELQFVNVSQSCISLSNYGLAAEFTFQHCQTSLLVQTL